MGKRWEELVKMQDARSAGRQAREAAACRLTDAELRDAIDAGEAASVVLNRRLADASAIVENRIAACERGVRGAALFAPDDLTYAGRARCPCGAGLAYPDGCDPFTGAWRCSAILTGAAEPGTTHESPKPFSMYDIKSENEHASGGATTRPS